jgi:hypothetical protein
MGNWNLFELVLAHTTTFAEALHMARGADS